MGHLGYHDLHTVEPRGIGGGLALIWKEEVNLKVLYSDRRLIDILIKWQDKEFHLTCVYGDPVKEYRGEVWERLSRLGASRSSP